ncbi:MAG TPA: hypothetical protein VHY37_11480, partial [Tepidisphaeraceae bacterium]|nr:hypothetical protein [Tepidisphaeraceae bacterium]
MFHFGRLKQNRVLTIAAAAGLGLAYGTAAPARATVIIEDHFTLGDPADNGQPTRFSSGNGGDAG